MQATLTAFDFKQMPDQKFNNIRLPRHIGAVTPSARLVEGLIFAYASAENNVFARTYAGIGREINVAPSTVAEAMKRLKNCGRITTSAQSVYSYNRAEAPKKYDHGVFGGINFFVCPEYLYKSAFYIRGNVRTLTKSEVAIASLIITLSLKDDVRDVKLSVRDVARELGLCNQTILTSLNNLVYSGIISRGKDDKGTNRNKKTTYHVKKELFFNARKWVFRKKNPENAVGMDKQAPETSARKAYKPAPAPLNVKDEYFLKHKREEWYAQRRQLAEERADKAFERAMRDAEYNRIYKEKNALTIKRAFAELQQSKLTEVDARFEELTRQEDDALKRLKLCRSDFEPHYHCTDCNDTGFDANGKPCHCYDSSALKNKN